MKTIRKFNLGHYRSCQQIMEQVESKNYFKQISSSINSDFVDGFLFDIPIEMADILLEEVFLKLPETKKPIFLRFFFDNFYLPSNVSIRRKINDKIKEIIPFFINGMQNAFPNVTLLPDYLDFITPYVNNKFDPLFSIPFVRKVSPYDRIAHDIRNNIILDSDDPQYFYFQYASDLFSYPENKTDVPAILNTGKKVIVDYNHYGESQLWKVINLLDGKDENLYVCSSKSSDIRKLMRTPN